MKQPHATDKVKTILDRLSDAGEGENVSVADIVEEIGGGAFGPLLLVPALILVTPASGIPGVPSIGSLIISLIAVQIVIGRDSLWLPGFINRRELKKSRLEKAIGVLRKPAQAVDWIMRRRLVFLTERPFSVVPALICSSMVLFAPAFETIPFSVTIAAAAVAFFALAFVAKDGLVLIVGLLVTAGAVAGGIALVW